MEEKIVITVLMPAYNAADYIGDAICSVLTQSFTKFELLIINDGSTDETENIIKTFGDERIKLITQDNMGVAGALNTGLKYANGKYIARFDADDICNPLRLALQYQFLETHPGYVICGSNAKYIDMFAEFVFNYSSPGYTHEQIMSLPYHVCPFIHSSTFFLKNAIVSEGGYDIHAHGFEDHFLWRKVLRKGKGYNLTDALISVRLNPASVTMDEQYQPKAYKKLKHQILKSETINNEQGELLKNWIKENHPVMMHESYYRLLAKKYLWNNYSPEKARENIHKSVINGGSDLHSTILLALSYLPYSWLKQVYQLKKLKQRIYAY
ncbi:MAG: glycosyltransferase [Chitinophagaceae bacterium]|nr:glycosyltransferase [Chitinophagaceae bacterium]